MELVDTAGLDPSLRESDATGIANRAQDFSDSVARTADIVILCVDATRPMSEWERSRFMTSTNRLIIAATKMDQALDDWASEMPNTQSLLIPCSAATGQGLERLRAVLVEKIGMLNNNSSSWQLGTSARCFESVEGALGALQRARDANRLGAGDELVAAELRLALEHIGEIVGAVHNEEILDRLFSRFCIGK
jgi:tRNA modification GTPase